MARSLFAVMVVMVVGCSRTDAADAGGAASASAAASSSAAQVTLAPIDSSAPTATATSTAPVATLGGSNPLGLTKPITSLGTIPIPTTLAPLGSASAGTGGASAQVQLRACCAALGKQAQQQSAQAAQLAQAAAMCNGLVAAMGNAPSVPQLQAVKAMMQGVPLPPVCQGL